MGITASPGGNWFATEDQNGSITIWSAIDGSEYRTFQAFTAYSQLALPRHLSAGSDTNTLAVAAGDTLHVIDVRTVRELRTFTIDNSIWEIESTPQQKMVLASLSISREMPESFHWRMVTSSFKHAFKKITTANSLP